MKNYIIPVAFSMEIRTEKLMLSSIGKSDEKIEREDEILTKQQFPWSSGVEEDADEE